MIDILIKRLRERANFMSECGGSGLWIKLDEIIALLDEIGRLREQIADAADFDGAAQLIKSMAQRIPLSDDEINALIEEKEPYSVLAVALHSPYRRAGPRHQERGMNGWKVVPVEPTGLMVDAGREAMQRAPDLGGIVSANTAEVMDSYTAMLTVAPTPPVVLPPLPPHPRDSWGLWDADEKRAIEDYVRAALAQYGIVDRHEDAA